MRQAFDEVAKQIDLPGHQDPRADTLRLVKEWFESDASGQWLLIFDNVDDTELLYPSKPHCIRYADYLPRSETGSILLTTRNGRVGHEFAAAHNVLTLAGMNAEESVSLLSTRLSNHQPEEELKELRDELGQIPLALVQAASFITQNNLTVGRYLQLYHQSDSTKVQLLSDHFEDEERDALSKNAIATTWCVSFEYIEKHEPQAADLLSFISMLANEGVPEFLLPHGADPVNFEKAIGTLQAFSFISTRYVELDESQHRLFDFHRLVRVAMRNWLTMNGRFDSFTAHAIEELAVVLDRPDLEKYAFRSQFMPHATELLALEQLQGVSGLEDVPSIFLKYKVRKKFSLLHRKPKEECMHDGSICPHCMLRILSYMSRSLLNVGDDISSISYQQRKLAICTHLFGESGGESLFSLYCLVVLNQRLSEYETAEILCRKLIENSKRKFRLVGGYNILGMAELPRILKKRNKHAEADAVERQLIDSCRHDINQTCSTVNLQRLTKLADVLYTRREYGKAAKYQLRVVEGYKSTRGSQDASTISALNRLAFTYFHLSRYDEAEGYQRITFDYSKTVHGLVDPNTIDDMLALSLILRWQSKTTEADDLAESALSISAKTFGDSNPAYLRHLRRHRNFLRQYELNDKHFWDRSL